MSSSKSNSPSLGESLDLTEAKEKLDASCKEVLANKIVLSKILQGVCPEYKNLSLEQIEKLIEGKPSIGNVPVGKDFTGQYIAGMANEDSSNYEGVIRYDIRFKAKLPGSNGKAELIINVEAQGNFNPGYSLVTRGIYYAARMISAQNGVEFKKSHYGEIKKVYSIWVCMNPNQAWENTVTSYTIHEHNLIGCGKEVIENYDKVNVTLICLQNNVSEISNDVVGFLTTLFSEALRPEDKKEIMKATFGIDASASDLERGMKKMEFSEIYFKRGEAKGISALVSTLKEMGMAPEAIIGKVAEKFGLSEEDAREAYNKYA